jgi:hypothetical protein
MCGVGRPLGILPELSTRTSPLASSDSSVGTASATSEATEAIRVRLNTTIRSNAEIPTAAATSVMSAGWVITLKASTTAGLPFCGEPNRSASCPRMMFTATR